MSAAATTPDGEVVARPQPLGVVPPRRVVRTNLRARLTAVDAVALAGAWLIVELLLHPAQQPLLARVGSIAAFAGLGVFTFGVLGLYRARVCSLRAIEHTKLGRSCLLLALLGLSSIPLLGGLLTIGEVVLGCGLALLFTGLAAVGSGTGSRGVGGAATTCGRCCSLAAVRRASRSETSSSATPSSATARSEC